VKGIDKKLEEFRNWVDALVKEILEAPGANDSVRMKERFESVIR
jgi:hypothetical protein